MFILTKLFAACGLCATLCSGAAAESITLSNGEWLPYLSEKAPHHGVISRIVSEAFALEGVTVHYVFRPWHQAYQEAASGAVSGSVGWSDSRPGTDRGRRFYFSDTIFTGQSVFFHLKSVPFDWTTLDQLGAVSMGGTAGYEYQFDSDIHLQMDRTAPTDAINFRKLLAGRFAVFPSNLDVGRQILRTQFTPEQAAQFTWHPRPYNIARYHLILSRRKPANARYLALFNRGLQRLKASGRYTQYMGQLQAGTD